MADQQQEPKKEAPEFIRNLEEALEKFQSHDIGRDSSISSQDKELEEILEKIVKKIKETNWKEKGWNTLRAKERSRWKMALAKIPEHKLEYFYRKILDEIKNIDELNNSRNNLGPSHGCTVTNKGFVKVRECYKQKKQTYNFEDAAGQSSMSAFDCEMQIVALEPIRWHKDVFLSHVCVNISEYENDSWKLPQDKYRECYAFRAKNIKDQEKIKNTYSKKMREYIKDMGGSTVQYRLDLKDGLLSFSLIKRRHEDMSFSFVGDGIADKERIYISNPKLLEYDDIGDSEKKIGHNDYEESAYIDKVIKPTFNPIFDQYSKEYVYGAKHLAIGNDTNFMAEANNITAVAHIYIVNDNSQKFKLSNECYAIIITLLQQLAASAISEVLRERQKALEKQSQMLNLLKAPLDRLTEALRTTDESAQRIRAVLYDPSSSIFASAHRIHPYFEDNRTVHVAGFSWSVPHKWMHPPPAGKEKEQDQHLSLTVLAIIANLFSIKFNEEHDSDEEKSPTAALKLWERVNNRLFDSSSAEEQMRKTCRDILFTNFSNPCRQEDEGQLWFGLRERVVGICCFNDALRKHWIGVVSHRFKLLLLEPYKFNLKQESILPLALILYEKNSTCELCIKSTKMKSAKEEEVKEVNFKSFKEVLKEVREIEKLFYQCKLPCYKTINLWTLILRLAALKIPKKATCNIKNDERMKSFSTEIQIRFNGDVFEGDKFGGFMKRLEPLITWETEGGYAPGGDSTLPWFDFALSCKADKRPASKSPQNGKSDAFHSVEHEVSYADSTLKIICDGSEFSISYDNFMEDDGTTMLKFKASNNRGGVV